MQQWDMHALAQCTDWLHVLQNALILLQETGETIFVPSGWHHTVHNLENTLSINHNWLNGYNIHWAWALLQQEHSDATAAIEDCRYTAYDLSSSMWP